MKSKIESFVFAVGAQNFYTREVAEELLQSGMQVARNGAAEIVAFLSGGAMFTFQRKAMMGVLPEVLRGGEYCALRTAAGATIATCVMYPEKI